LCVGYRLLRGKGFGSYDEQGLRGIEIASRFHEVGGVDVGNEAKGHRAIAVVLEPLVGHHRPEIRTANADVDDAADPSPAVAFPGADTDTVGEISHLVENRMHLGHDVFAIHDDGCVSRRAQSDVQDGSPLGDVDFLAPEHGIDLRAQACFRRQLQEKLKGLVGDPIFRVIEE
jgi:hypothetical protein